MGWSREIGNFELFLFHWHIFFFLTLLCLLNTGTLQKRLLGTSLARCILGKVFLLEECVESLGTYLRTFFQKSVLFKKREFFRFWKLCFCLLLLKRMSSCATSFACADFDVAITFFTLNETTPMKLAFATFDSSFSFGFKATIATHLVATFRTISFL